MQTVQVDLGDRSYPIRIGHGTLGDFGEAYAALDLGRRTAVVTDSNLPARYLEPVRQSLDAAGVSTVPVTVPAGESHKTLATVDHLCGEFIRAGLDRASCVVALGGGVVGDTAGFAAAVYQRGIDFVQVPTTVLAQVDASVGGKTAVDHALGKNMVGAFHQPRLVYIDTETLFSLPPRELRSGLAEVVKHALIRDPELVDFLERRVGDLLSLEVEPEELDWLIARNCQIKADVVSADEKESGLREILNYGHTVGHALEAATEYRQFRHGEAVSLGMLAVAHIARARGLLGEEAFLRHNTLVSRLGLPGGADAIGVDDLLGRMASDKKTRDGVIRFVLLQSIGHASPANSATRQEVVAGIRYMQGFVPGSR